MTLGAQGAAIFAPHRKRGRNVLPFGIETPAMPFFQSWWARFCASVAWDRQNTRSFGDGTFRKGHALIIFEGLRSVGGG